MKSPTQVSRKEYEAWVAENRRWLDEQWRLIGMRTSKPGNRKS